MARIPLTLFPRHDGTSARAAITCRYKCGDACFHAVPNRSRGQYFGDIAAAVSRRRALTGTAALVLAVGAGGAFTACGSQTADSAAGEPGWGMDFPPVAPNTQDAVVVPEGYDHQVVIRWGDPLFADTPAFDFAQQTAAAQARQFGFNNDFAGLLPVDGVAHTYLLVVNHEYTTEPMMFRRYQPGSPTREQVDIALAAHGLSVVEVVGEPESGRLTPKFGRFNRRITATTEFTLTGPAAGSELLKTTADPTGGTVRGTINNCSGGVTPWGTVLSGEENFHQYFAHADTITDPVAAERFRRYGITGGATQRRWELFESRFDIAQEPQEAHRFGYIVEVNPWDPESTPVKHTALGRFKHESATIHVTSDGTVVAYSGDDERFDYMYKFVSAKKMRPGSGARSMRHNMTLLAEGTLYVAQLSGDHPEQIDGSGSVPEGGLTGTGRWIPLLATDSDGRGTSFVPDMTAEEVAVFTRLAGDAVEATAMDRPEDIETNPRTGKVYVALTNNKNRAAEGHPGVDAANPRRLNKNGQVLELVDDHAGTEFTWSLLLACGDPAAADTYYGGFDKAKVSPISCPDNLTFDPHGNLWIATDGNALGSNDGLFAVVTEGEERGKTKQFLTVPVGAETCGPVVQENRVLVSVQHPGESDDATVEHPTSHWPDGGTSQPRPAIVAAWRTNGGRIGR